MEFCMAVLLIERKAGLEQFTDAVVNRPTCRHCCSGWTSAQMTKQKWPGSTG